LKYYKPLVPWSPDWREISSQEGEKYPHVVKQDDTELALTMAAKFFGEKCAIGKFSLEVKLWADGITPVTQKINLNIEPYSDKTRILFEEILNEAVLYENDHHSKEVERDWEA
jgi:hypothetical protein